MLGMPFHTQSLMFGCCQGSPSCPLANIVRPPPLIEMTECIVDITETLTPSELACRPSGLLIAGDCAARRRFSISSVAVDSDEACLVDMSCDERLGVIRSGTASRAATLCSIQGVFVNHSSAAGTDLSQRQEERNAEKVVTAAEMRWSMKGRRHLRHGCVRHRVQWPARRAYRTISDEATANSQNPSHHASDGEMVHQQAAKLVALIFRASFSHPSEPKNPHDVVVS